MSRLPSPGCSGALRLVLAIASCDFACGVSRQASTDAGTDYVAVDVPPMSDVGMNPLALDFSATGCAAFDPVASRCDGTAPLALAFTPIGSQELIHFLWDFGDGTATSSERSPTHVYALPGSFPVTLVAGGGPGVGTVPRSHDAYVNVIPAPAGARCDVNLQCADGLSCWCGSSNPCTPLLSRGLCGRPCDAAAGGPELCPDHTICADLSTKAPTPASVLPGAASSWRRPLCLPVCVDDRDCTGGFRCRDLPAPTPTGSWVRACFETYPLPLGARCGDAGGKPVDADCASRLCADLGAFGRCSADCAVGGCPMGTACAQFGDGRRLCLATCAGAGGCNDDPLLACEAPGATGPLGFVATGNPPVSGGAAPTYCAPKRCATSSDCGPAGTCPVGGGHCKRPVP